MSEELKAVKENAETVIVHMRKSQVQTNMLVIVVALGAMLGLGALYVHSSNGYERQIARAEERETAYIERLETMTEKWSEDMKRINELEKHQAELDTQIRERDREADAVIERALEVGRSDEDVAQDVQVAYQFAPFKIDPGLLTFTTPQTQTFVATKIDRDRLFGDYSDVQSQLKDEQEQFALLETDLVEAQGQIEEAGGVIEGYKKAAKKTKWKRFMDNAKKVGLFVGGIYVGRALN